MRRSRATAVMRRVMRRVLRARCSPFRRLPAALGTRWSRRLIAAVVASAHGAVVAAAHGAVVASAHGAVVASAHGAVVASAHGAVEPIERRGQVPHPAHMMPICSQVPFAREHLAHAVERDSLCGLMSLLHLSRAIIETLHISVPTVVQSWRGTLTPDRCDERLYSWSRRLLAQAQVQLNVNGVEQVPAHETFIIMSNHQSLYDIPVLYQALQRRIRMVAKAELFNIPVWSQAMRSAGFIPVDRRNRSRAISSLRAAERALRDGTSIWIAPEGTRSESGALGEFKLGGFHIALGTGARILPVTIEGTRDVLPARGWTVRTRKTVNVTVSDPIDPAQYGSSRRKELVEAVRVAIAQHLRLGREGASNGAAMQSANLS